jgi:hypothetical protein
MIMKKTFLFLLIPTMVIFCFPAFSQTGSSAGNDTTLLGLPGDNLDLYAVLDLFQKSKTIEDFEKSLNGEKTGINNLDLNLDNKVDFIKVVTKQEGDDFTFVLQVDVSEKEIQDVAVILVSKDKDKKITMQIVGDKDLYGKDYVIEPKVPAPAATPNPGYVPDEPAPAAAAPVVAPAAAPAAAPSTTTVVVVEQTPIVQYVYSPVYVPYYPPYHYAFYPPYFAAFAVVAVSVYHHNNYYHHHGYHGGYGNTTVVVHNTNNYNNYNNSRNTSNTVNHNKANGSYNGNRPANTNSNRPTASPTNQPRGTSASPSTSQSRSSSASPSTSQSKGSSSSGSSSRRSSRSGGGGRRR